MSTNPGYAVYFIGGPFDLTKRMYPGSLPRGPWLPMVEPMMASGIDWTTPPHKTVKEYKSCLYKIEQGPVIVQGTVTVMAIYQPERN